MAWIELAPISRAGSIDKAAILVGMGTNGAGGRFKPWVQMLFRPAQLAAPWLEVGKTVKVEHGDIDGVPMLRITPKGPFLLVKSGGKIAASGLASTLRIPGFARQAPEAKPLRGVTYTLESAGGGCLLIELPNWAISNIPPGVPRQNGATLPPAPPPGTPYKMGGPSHAQVLKDRGVVR